MSEPLTPTLAGQARKTCPRCAEDIRADTETCPYCGGRFRVWAEGYCATCHRVSAGGTEGRCATCGSELVDLRIESRLLEEAEPAAPAETRRPPLRRSLLGGLIGAALVGVVLWQIAPWERSTTPGGGTGATAARPLPSARLAGAFDVTARTTWTAGWESLKAGSTFDFPDWSFGPSCAHGACRVRLSIAYPESPAGTGIQIFPAPIHVALRRSGAVYQGKGTAGLARCDGRFHDIGTINVWLRVTRGAWIDGAWRATRLRGTVRYSEPAKATCTAAGFTAKLTGRLVG